MADLEQPTGGELLIAGRPADEARRERQYGYVFQAPALMEWRTVLRNVLLPLEVMNVPGDRLGRAREMLKLVGLEKFERNYPWQLSGGMQQRVSIARALAFDPPLLFMDEPFGALDEITREHLNLELLRLWRETGKTVIFVTHSIPEAVFLSTRVVVMTARPGRIEGVVDIDLPHPRSDDTREDPASSRSPPRSANCSRRGTRERGVASGKWGVGRGSVPLTTHHCPLTEERRDHPAALTRGGSGPDADRGVDRGGAVLAADARRERRPGGADPGERRGTELPDGAGLRLAVAQPGGARPGAARAGLRAPEYAGHVALALPYNVGVTAGETLLGLLLATVTGIGLALLLVASRAFERATLPWLVASQTVPVVAIAPMLAVLLGQYGVQGFLPKAIIAAYIAFFPVAVGMSRGLRSADPLHLDLMRTYHASPAQTYRLLRFPASLPHLFTALKVAVTSALVGSIVAEISTISFSGLGKMLAENSRASDTVALWVIMAYGALLGVTLVALVNALERWVTPWTRR